LKVCGVSLQSIRDGTAPETTFRGDDIWADILGKKNKRKKKREEGKS